MPRREKNGIIKSPVFIALCSSRALLYWPRPQPFAISNISDGLQQYRRCFITDITSCARLFGGFQFQASKQIMLVRCHFLYYIQCHQMVLCTRPEEKYTKVLIYVFLRCQNRNFFIFTFQSSFWLTRFLSDVYLQD